MIATTGVLPWPVPPGELPWWSADYADIRDRIRRDGAFATEDIWLPDSEDSWPAFLRRHTTADFFLDWRALNERAQRGYHRYSERVRREQEAWETAQRQRRQEAEANADREWREIELAKNYWSAIDPAFRWEPYHNHTLAVGCMVLGRIKLQAGQAYWLPLNVVLAITGQRP